MSDLASTFNDMISKLRIAQQGIRHLNADLEQRVIERTAELKSTTEQVEAILNNSSDAIILAHPNGTILRTNHTFNHIFGYSGTEIVQQPLTALFEPAQVNTITETIRVLIETNQPQRLGMVL